MSAPVGLHEIEDRVRHLAELNVTAAQLVGDIHGHAGRLGLGAVPTLRKWNERPRQLVIVRDGFF
jgi:hypothetical protein